MAKGQPNQKGSAPRFKPAAGVSIRRSDFVGPDYKYKTYYGPGQPPSSGDYAPPDDWIKAGFLLYVPQTVWLTLVYDTDDASTRFKAVDFRTAKLIRSNQTTEGDGTGKLFLTFDYAWDDGHSYNPRYEIFPDPSVFASDPPYVVGGLNFAVFFEPSIPVFECDSEIPNAGDEEYTTLLPVFREVKSRIEGLRPGRTWVLINDCTVKAKVPLSFSGYSPLIAPAPGVDFFGTNFLHVHAGWVSDGGSPPGPTSLPKPGDPGDVAGRANVTGSWKKFAGYTVWVYGPARAPAEFGNCGGKDPVVNGLVNGQNQTRAAAYGGTISYLVSTCDDMKDFGYTYKGSAGLLSAGSLVSGIADFFGFSETTGKDRS